MPSSFSPDESVVDSTPESPWHPATLLRASRSVGPERGPSSRVRPCCHPERGPPRAESKDPPTPSETDCTAALSGFRGSLDYGVASPPPLGMTDHRPLALPPATTEAAGRADPESRPKFRHRGIVRDASSPGRHHSSVGQPLPAAQTCAKFIIRKFLIPNSPSPALLESSRIHRGRANDHT